MKWVRINQCLAVRCKKNQVKKLISGNSSKKIMNVHRYLLPSFLYPDAFPLLSWPRLLQRNCVWLYILAKLFFNILFHHCTTLSYNFQRWVCKRLNQIKKNLVKGSIAVKATSSSTRIYVYLTSYRAWNSYGEISFCLLFQLDISSMISQLSSTNYALNFFLPAVDETSLIASNDEPARG